MLSPGTNSGQKTKRNNIYSTDIKTLKKKKQ